MQKYLEFAGVPQALHEQALASFALARKRIGWLNIYKFWVRFMRAGVIADFVQWDDERLIDVEPDVAQWDIAPMVNITAHGDNTPWVMTPDGQRPAPGRWLDRDPASAEYQQAVSMNYWCPGEHPRSWKSRRAWYRRNACEYMAWERGEPVSTTPTVWHRQDERQRVTVLRSGSVWHASIKRKCWFFWLETNVGFEVGNVFAKVAGQWVQSWYPLPGYELRACVTSSTIPTLKGLE